MTSERKDISAKFPPLRDILPYQRFYKRGTPPEKMNKNVFYDAIENMVIDPKSIELFKKGGHNQRYAGIGVIRKQTAESVPTLELFFRPTLEYVSSDGEHHLDEKHQKHNEQVKKNLSDSLEYLVQSNDPARPGVVHSETLKQLAKEDPTLKSVKDRFILGLSAKIVIDESTGKMSIEWVNRSIKNSRTFTRDPLAEACLIFDDEGDQPKSNKFKRPIPEKVFIPLVKKAVTIIFEDKDKPSIKSLHKIKRINFEDENEWNDICNLDEEERRETISSILMKNICLFTDLPELDSDDNKKIFIILKNGFAAAQERKIVIDVNKTPDDEDQPPLILAVTKGHLGVVELLLSHGANPNVRNDKGQTSLELAAKSGDLKITKSLLEKLVMIAEYKLSAENDLKLLQLAESGAVNAAFIEAVTSNNANMVNLLMHSYLAKSINAETLNSAYEIAKSNNNSFIMFILGLIESPASAELLKKEDIEKNPPTTTADLLTRLSSNSQPSEVKVEEKSDQTCQPVDTKILVTSPLQTTLAASTENPDESDLSPRSKPAG